MGLFKSKKGSIISDYFQAVNQIGVNNAGDMVDVALYEDHLTIKGMLNKQEITLRYSQITDVFYGYQTEIVNVNKSVIGRAVAGGLLFGGVGAVVGAVSGSGTKEKKELHLNFIISYTGSNGEDAFLHFEDTRKYKGKKVADQLRELCNLDESQENISL